jgi:hypothetical protein
MDPHDYLAYVDPVEITLVHQTGVATPALDWPQEATREE